MKKYYISLFLVFFLISCSSNISKSDLIGRWHNIEGSTQKKGYIDRTTQFFPNDTYVEEGTVYYKNRKYIYKIKGSWSIKTKRIMFKAKESNFPPAGNIGEENYIDIISIDKDIMKYYYSSGKESSMSKLKEP